MGIKAEETEAFVHTGVVSEMKGSSIIVSLDKNVHCESCNARGACGVTDTVNKTVEINNPEGSFKLNQPVEVILKKDLGQKAVYWAYIFPFLLVLATLVTSSLFLPEWMAGLLSLLILIPYYGTVYAFKDYFKKKFRISVLSI
ncbi:SoxR reducing system RseC family protein [Lentiprolixibacter aurantiacus]|uniref:SoxR reducing system RseC family protein n=1 Tax=Lentiprolixibacter aurantiacus TaxID=2993939 RepID=A0AAE3SN94_9FLAO|nr:SoxR reducing system RseC family protein [Lentiprolixibacter aurantiacus]MCX2718202.1 SoxR reducing system RseC family protein [Lentiprolixibacter aurantiacus]